MHHVIVAPGKVAIRALDLDDARAGSVRRPVQNGAVTACSRATTRIPSSVPATRVLSGVRRTSACRARGC
jgi:hypothetical protein